MEMHAPRSRYIERKTVGRALTEPAPEFAVYVVGHLPCRMQMAAECILDLNGEVQIEGHATSSLGDLKRARQLFVSPQPPPRFFQ